MSEHITKLVSTMVVWIATATILIKATFNYEMPIAVILIFVTGFSTAVIWNYSLSKMKK